MAARNLFTLVDGESPGERRPQAVETLHGFPEALQQEVWHRGPPKARREPRTVPTPAASATATCAKPQRKLSEKEALDAGTPGRPLQPSSPDTRMRKEEALGSPPLVQSGTQRDKLLPATAEGSSQKIREYEQFEQNDIWNVPVAPTSSTPPETERDASLPTSLETPSGQQHQQEKLQREEKRNQKQQLPQHQRQRHHIEQHQKQLPQQLPGVSEALPEAIPPAPITAAAEQKLQQLQQLPERERDEEGGEEQQQQQSQDTPSIAESGSLRCLSVFPPDTGGAVPDCLHNRTSSSRSSSSRSSISSRREIETPSSEGSWGWLSPVATERNP